MDVRLVEIDGKKCYLFLFDTKQKMMLLLTGIRRYARTLNGNLLKQEIIRDVDLLERQTDKSISAGLYEIGGVLPETAGTALLQALFMSAAMENL